MAMDEQFAVVKFTDENSVEAIPSKWLFENDQFAYWPKKPIIAEKAIKVKTDPSESWDVCKVQLLLKCKSYGEARVAAKKAEYTSDCGQETDLEVGRGYKRKMASCKEYDEDSDSSVDGNKRRKGKNFKPAPILSLDAIELPFPGSPVIDLPDGVVDNVAEIPSTAQSISSSFEAEKGFKAVLLAVSKLETLVEENNRLLLMYINKKQEKTVFEDVTKDLLPLSTMEEFLQFEEKIRDDDFKNALIHRLQILGGASVKQAVKNLIEFLMVGSLQYLFNWEGRSGWNSKKPTKRKGFKTTQLCGIIASIVVKNERFTTDNSEVEKAIMLYLRNASDRVYGRKRPAVESCRNHGDSNSSPILSNEHGALE